MNRFRGRRALLALTIGGIAAAPFVSGVPPVGAEVKKATIKEDGSSFDPKRLAVAAADDADQVEVSWTFVKAGTDGRGHGVKFDDGTDLSPNCPGALEVLGNCQTSPGQTVTQRLSPGTYPYYCKIHGGPGGVGMAGVVTISVMASTTTSSTLPRATTTSSTARMSSTSGTTPTTTKPLATSSTLASSSTTSTTADTSSVLLPNDPPPFAGDDVNAAAGQTGGSDDGSDSKTVALIVVLLLAVSGAGGFLLWRLRPGRA